MKAVIFARVSSVEQEDGYSTDAQVAKMQEYCQRNGLDIIKIFRVTESSTKGERTQFHEALNFAKSQKETVAFVSDKVDRLTRSFSDYGILDELMRSGSLELHFAHDHKVLHKDSDSGDRLMWNMQIMMAQSYTDSLRDNVKRSMDYKIKQGEYPSKAPIGYKNIRLEDGKADIVLDEERAFMVKRLFEEFSTGNHSVQEMANRAKAWGLTARTSKANPVSKQHMHRILRSPFYSGIMKVN